MEDPTNIENNKANTESKNPSYEMVSDCEQSNYDSLSNDYQYEDSQYTEESDLMLIQLIDAVKENNIELIDVLTQNLTGENDLESKLHLFILNIVFLNRKDKEGFCPIHYAVLFGNIKAIVKLMTLNSQTDILTEGVPLFHLSLSFASIFI